MTKKISVKIGGMFCPSCEKKIANALSKTAGVTKAAVSYQKGKAEIEYNGEETTAEAIRQVILDAGYEPEKSAVEPQSLYFLIIAAALWLILDRFGVLNLFRSFPEVQAGMSYGLLFVIGMLTSVHCIAMCGGINLSQSVSAAKNNGRVLRSNLLYNLGRVLSYTLIGGIVGAVGAVISFGGVFRGIVAMLAGIFMILMGANMLGFFRFFRFRIPARITVPFQRLRRGSSSFVIGLLNGLMPCGPLQTMQLYALYTGSFFGGAFSMLLFSTGTVPLMLLFGTLSGRLSKRFASKLLTASAVLIVVLGIGMLGNGMSLSGLRTRTGTGGNETAAVVSAGVQSVETEIDYGAYPPIRVKKGIPVKWTVVVPQGKLNGCNNELIIPKYHVDVKLREGENLIEFTPEESGTVSYSCWMGMIRSTVTVTD